MRDAQRLKRAVQTFVGAFYQEIATAMDKQEDKPEEKSQEKTRFERHKPSLLMNYSVILASCVVILAGIHAARSILGPFLMAMFFAMLLVIPLNKLQNRGLSKAWALTLLLIGVLFCGVGAATIVAPQLSQFTSDIPIYRERFTETLRTNNIHIEEFLPDFLKDEPDAQEEQEDEAPSRSDESNKNSGRPSVGKETRRAERAHRARLVSYEEPARKFRVDADANSNASDLQISDAQLGASALDAPGLTDVDRLVAASANLESDSLLPANPNQNLAPKETGGNLTPVPPDFVGDFENAAASVLNVGELDDQAEEDYGENLRAPQHRGSAVDDSSRLLFKFLSNLTGELSYFVSAAFLIILLIAFMLVEAAKLPQKLERAFGKLRITNSHIDGIIADVRNYMVIKTMMSLLVGVSVTLLLMILRVEYPILWGFVAFLLNYIPNIGSTVASIPPIVLALTEHGLLIGIIVIAFLVAINCTVGYVLEPKLLGKGLDLSPLIILISLIFFGWLLGPVGMFLSPPLAVVIKIIFRKFPETEWIGVLMANKIPEEDPTEEASLSKEANATEKAG